VEDLCVAVQVAPGVLLGEPVHDVVLHPQVERDHVRDRGGEDQPFTVELFAPSDQEDRDQRDLAHTVDDVGEHRRQCALGEAARACDVGGAIPPRRAHRTAFA
jgi:hypothetical protein